MRNYKSIFLFVVLFLIPVYPQQTAKDILNKSFKAIGGKSKLENLKSIETEKIGYRHWLEQSERPEGPWVMNFEEIHEIRDIKNNRLWKKRELKSGQMPEWSGRVYVISDSTLMIKIRGRNFPGSYSQFEDEEDAFNLSPERILLTAEQASDLKYRGEKIFNGIPHLILSFSYRDTRVKLFISSFTHLISAVETVKAYPDDFFQSVWGDANFTTKYADYNLEEGGIRYPHLWSIDWNGYPYSEYSITKLKMNSTVPADSFKISDEIKEQFEQRKTAPKFTPQTYQLGQGFNRKIGERSIIGKNVIIIPGIYTVTLIPQEDGILIIEAPISSHYTKLVIEEVEKQFPQKKIKAVISTGDAWTYMGGMREYVAQNIPVYALNLNEPIIKRLLDAPHTIIPDDLSKKGIKEKINSINDKYKIGEGKNRVEIYPVKGSGGERMMLVYFPEYKILYSSDLIQPRQNGSFFAPEYLLEVSDCVKRNKLKVDKIYGMHIGLKDWKDVEKAINDAMK